MEEHLKQKKNEVIYKIENKEIKLKEQFERTQRQNKLRAEFNKIKKDERLEEAKRLEKAKSYQLLRKQEEIEAEKLRKEIIEKEKEKLEVSFYRCNI